MQMLVVYFSLFQSFVLCFGASLFLALSVRILISISFGVVSIARVANDTTHTRSGQSNRTYYFKYLAACSTWSPAKVEMKKYEWS